MLNILIYSSFVIFYKSHRTWTCADQEIVNELEQCADPEIVNEWSTGGFYLLGKVQSLFDYVINLINLNLLGGLEHPSLIEL